MPTKLDELDVLITAYDKLFTDRFISESVHQAAIASIKFLRTSIQVDEQG